MSFIKNLDKRETFSYRFSVYEKTDEDLIALKKQIKKWNKDSIDKKRISLMARGPRIKNSYNTLHKDAKYFDVYVHDVINWENFYLKRRRELEIQDDFVEGIKNELWNFLKRY